MPYVKEQTSERPEPVEFKEQYRGWEVYLHTDIEEHKDESGNTFFTNNFTFLTLGKEELTEELKAAILADPAAFVNYIPTADRATVQQQYTDAVQHWMDSTAHERGYDDIFTAISYADSAVAKFKSEGQACKKWRDSVWVACYAYLDDVISGKKELMPIDDLLKVLPQLEW